MSHFLNTDKTFISAYASLQLDYVFIRGLDESDGQDEATKHVRKAFTDFSKVTHPDKKGDCLLFQKVKEAYDLLKTFNDRQNYNNRFGQQLERERKSNTTSRALVATNSSAANSSTGGKKPASEVMILATVDAGRACTTVAHRQGCECISHMASVDEDINSAICEQLCVLLKGYGGVIEEHEWDEEMLSSENRILSRRLAASFTDVHGFCRYNAHRGFEFIGRSNGKGFKVKYTAPSLDNTLRQAKGSVSGSSKSKASDISSMSSAGDDAGTNKKNTHCPDYPAPMSGQCPNGKKCPYKHEKKVCAQYKRRGHCPRGDQCWYRHPDSVAKKAATVFEWNRIEGHKTILIVGGSGHGKSTFINSLDNFFHKRPMDKLQVVIPTQFHTTSRAHSEAAGDSTNSKTMDCTRYQYFDPANRNRSITFVDTPGLADTRGAKADDDNMSKVLNAAIQAEEDGSLAGIIVVMKGSENRRNISIQTVATILKCSLPDVIIDNMVAVFSFCRTESCCQSLSLLPFDIKDDNRFYYDNPIFTMNPSTMAQKDRSYATDCWRDTMSEITEILDLLCKQRFTPDQRVFRSFFEQKQRVKSMFHDIKNRLVHMQQVLEALDQAKKQQDVANATMNANQNFKVSKQVTQEVFEDDPSVRHSTICSTCNHFCHQNCGLDEITQHGSNAFQGCAAFNRNPHCLVCPEHCSFETHYHGRKVKKTVLQTVDEIIQEMHDKYLQAQGQANNGKAVILSYESKRQLVVTEMNSIVAEMERGCRLIKRMCSSFNLVDELALTLGQLEAEARNIRNVEARRQADQSISTIRNLINTLSQATPQVSKANAKKESAPTKDLKNAPAANKRK